MKAFLSILTLLAATSVFAQNSSSSPAPVQEKHWVEFSIPIDNTGPFKDKIDEELRRDAGLAGTYGWRPWVQEAANENSVLMRVLKQAGFSVSGTSLQGPSFDQYLYTSYKPIDYSQCYDTRWQDGRSYYHDNGICVPCPADVNANACTKHDVYGRDAYIKYSSGSIAIGTYLPVEFGKFTLLGGANIRMHFIRQGKQTDQIRDSYQLSTDLVVSARYKLSPHWSAAVSAEHSVVGLKFGQYSTGLVVRW